MMIAATEARRGTSGVEVNPATMSAVAVFRPRVVYAFG
jgi:hypothetical protein